MVNTTILHALVLTHDMPVIRKVSMATALSGEIASRDHANALFKSTLLESQLSLDWNQPHLGILRSRHCLMLD